MSNDNKAILIEQDFSGAVETAIQLVNSDGVFVYPTDTIYGIGADPFKKENLERINKIKGRGEEQKFILLADSLNTVINFADIDEKIISFLNKIWPGPVSVILPVKVNVQMHLGSSNIAFRIPDHKFCNAVLSKLKKPIISSSVNKTGSSPINNPSVILSEFSDVVDAIFYTNQNKNSSASTLIDLTGNHPVLLREGDVKYSDILSSFGN